MTEPELFPIASIVCEETPKEPPACRCPLFIVAYWPSGSRWRMLPETYEPNSAEMGRKIEKLKECGWTHIKVCKLPI